MTPGRAPASADGESPNQAVQSAWVCSPGINKTPFLRCFLPEYKLQLVPTPHSQAVLGWGVRRSSWVGRQWAAATNTPYISLEDGFLRSVGLGEQGAATLSLLVDRRGVHYDAQRPSDLEDALLSVDSWCDGALRDRARELVNRIVGAGLSKTNLGGPLDRSILENRRRVLLIDQTRGDASISRGLAGPSSFTSMVRAARIDEPRAQLIVKRHPAVAAGLKSGCIDPEDLHGVTLVDEDIRPAQLLAEVDMVYTVTSGLGFEALLRGLPVRCFGAPFYSGWGLTLDEVDTGRRSPGLDLPELAAAALIRCTRYVDPVRGEPCEAEQAVERLEALTVRANRIAGYWAGVGFAPPKRPVVRRLMNGPKTQVQHFTSADQAIQGAEAHQGGLLIWAGKESAAMTAAAAGFPGPVLRMEDGFVRSRGLGSNFVPALSVALDDQAIYYDPRKASRLETLIETLECSEVQRSRARRLRQSIVQARLSKYNQGGASPQAWPASRTRILVVGQVEDDRSILLGCEGVCSNQDLIHAVRSDFPDAFLIWKNHPDVVAGNRKGAVSSAALEQVDAIADHADISTCIDQASLVATMTSLSGFEALLRDTPVVTYGRPFYAGWGLTQDRLAFDRRTRRPDLDHLVYCALIAYPIYVTEAGWPCEAEDLVRALGASSPTGPEPRGGLWSSRWLTAVKTALAADLPPSY